MAVMGKYCKAYLAKQLREFPQWQENLQNLRQSAGEPDAAPRSELKDDDILYLHENYVVTDGIYQDENVIFDDVTPSWQNFCRETLAFQIPEYVADTSDEGARTEDSANE